MQLIALAVADVAAAAAAVAVAMKVAETTPQEDAAAVADVTKGCGYY